MASFVGRRAELDRLTKAFDKVRRDAGGDEPGRCILMHGRRRVGKSRLVERFLRDAGAPSIFYTASRQANEPSLFLEDLARSDLGNAEVAEGVEARSWEVALRLLDAALSVDEPAIVVIDEFPYLVEQDGAVESIFQKHWDRHLKKRPVLLLLVGSDIAVMEQLNSYGRGFHQRGVPFPLGPLSPVETAEIVAAPTAAAAFDAQLITGGLPLVCEEWAPGADMWRYLEEVLFDPTSALVVTGELALAAEFPAPIQARAVLSQIGSGERTFANIARAAGGLQAMSLNRALDMLAEKRVVAKDLPLSTKPSREARYRVADPYLRFWLRYIGPNMAKILRGRGDLVLEEVRRTYTDWRGRAIEPIVREAIGSASLAETLPGPVGEVAGYWTRTNTPEIDIVVGDRSPVAREIALVGSIKWHETRAVTQTDLNQLIADAALVPGVDANTPLLIVARGPVDLRENATVLTPEDLLSAWSG